MQYVTGLKKLSQCYKACSYIIVGMSRVAFSAFLLLTVMVSAAVVPQNKQVSLHLSNPDAPGLLRVNHYKGSILVRGYEGTIVEIFASYREDVQSEGMEKINRSTLELSGQEQNNEVRVYTDSHRRTVDLTIMVPHDFSLNLYTYDKGIIEVVNVRGEMEISNINGPVRLLDVAGSAVCSTVDGDILVKFQDITPGVPMAFSSLEGNIDITFPQGADASFKMMSDNGDIYTENDWVKKIKAPGKSSLSQDWSYGEINGGGAEILLKSLNGSIYIRKIK